MKTVSKDVNSSITINASKTDIFNIISDHEGTPNWVHKVKKVTLKKEGQPKNGVGAMREVVFRPMLWTTVQEEILSYDQNESFTYRIAEGMPGLVDHLGKWSLESTSDGKTKVTWAVHFDFSKRHIFSWFVGSFAKSFKKVQEEALNQLKENLEK